MTPKAGPKPKGTSGHCRTEGAERRKHSHDHVNLQPKIFIHTPYRASAKFPTGTSVTRLARVPAHARKVRSRWPPRSRSSSSIHSNTQYQNRARIPCAGGQSWGAVHCHAGRNHYNSNSWGIKPVTVTVTVMLFQWPSPVGLNL